MPNGSAWLIQDLMICILLPDNTSGDLMFTLLNTSQLEEALAKVGSRLEWPSNVEILLVGGAAGMITGVLPSHRTTNDCDVIRYDPEQARLTIESIAEDVGKELGYSRHWLNSNVQLRLDCLPDEWRERRIWVGTYGQLWVYAVSRLDLIAMKFIAHRAQDLQDLKELKVAAEDIAFVRQYLDRLPSKGTNAEEVNEARDYLSAWEDK
jgi:hypothetical protein